MSKLFIAFFLVFASSFISPLSAQSVNRDSLRDIIANPPDERADLEALRLLGRSYLTIPDSVLFYQRQALDLAIERGDSLWTARMRNFVAGTEKVVSGGFDEAVRLNQLALDYYERTEEEHPEYEIEALVNRGVLYQVRTEYGKAAQSYEQAYQLMEASGFKGRLATVLNNLGIIHRTQGDYRASIDVYQRSIKLKREVGDSLGWANSLSNIGVAYLQIDSLQDAQRSFEEARSIYRQLGLLGEAAGLDLNIATGLYQADRQLEALELWEATLVKDDLKTDAVTIVGVFGAMSEVYQDSLNDLDKSMEYVQRALEYLPYVNDRRLEIGLDLRMGRLYKALGQNDSAVVYFERHASGRQEFYESERIRNEQMMSEHFQSELQATELERQEAELARQDAEIALSNQRRRLLTLLSVALAGLALGIWLITRYRTRLGRAEIARQELERKQELERVQREAKLGELRSMIEGQEAERRRVAKDLHDGLGGLLTTVKANVNSLGALPGQAVEASATPAEVQKNKALSQAEQLIDRACKEVRIIAHNMLPQTLALSGLSGSLEDIQAQLVGQGLNCSLEIAGEPEEMLDEAQQSMLLRIVQELCQNSVKHAEAKEIFIQLLRQDDQLLLLVEDDGKGFNPEVLERKSKGLGLDSIQQRVTYLEGEILIDSQVGKGTSVSISVPIKEEQTSMNS
ncbi:MAG: tetratricopeptide repeat protein [Bacteroidota bacterium]